MSHKPLVSVIIIFLNASEKFFEEAIESVFAQTYDHWELLLVDDGSTDSSTTIALRYAEQYPQKVRYLDHEGHQNRGMSAARNLGIRNAKGEYIAFLDADDVWFPHKLEQQVPILNSQPEAAMLYGRTQFWFSWTGNSQDIQRDCMTKTSVQFDTLVNPPTQLILYLQDGEIYPCMCSVLIRRHVLEDLGGFEEEFRNANEDMVFHSKVFLKAPVFISSECWDRYRMHPSSYWQAAKTARRDTPSIARLTYLNWLEKYLSEQEIKDVKVWQALKQERWVILHPKLYRLLRALWNPVSLGKMLVKRIGRWTLPIFFRRWLRFQYQNMISPR
ncbi:glycosyltransferase family 2 protein [Scytonema sp. PCC 10023]|uniref:glycosyltransferase family 2 protein n=1 Tax=Scytonema sp. PCC 10023 TaxID=1680591 RepID=UPI0039C73D21